MHCPESSKRAVVLEQVVLMLVSGIDHPLWRQTFIGYEASQQKAAELNCCYEVIQLKSHAWADVSAIDDFIRTAINAVSSHIFLGTVTINDLCADGYSIRLFISDVSCAAMESFV